MKILVLTTFTSHHLFFLLQLKKFKSNNVVAIIEKDYVKFPYKTEHKIDAEIEKYEKKLWFKNNMPEMTDICENFEVNSINEKKTIDFIRKYRPNVVLVFGTRKIKSNIIDICKGKIYNFHGGNPEYYRGLDTNLWAIYHSQYSFLCTCLHEIDEKFDNGKIFGVKKINLKKNLKIFKLRSINTENCVLLANKLIKKISNRNLIVLKKQKYKGRYYSAMPSILKEQCVIKFNNYTNNL